MSRDLVLYGKPGCHLCEDVAAALGRLRRRFPHTLIEVDITRDHALLERYGERIPVLVLDGAEHAAPLSPERLERLLAAPPR